MITLGLPWALAAGAALAALVTALHFLAPRPPDRAPLPTARFLREDARTTLRFRRRPTHPGVLALRVLLALLLGLLFSRPQWQPHREDGTTRIVLLDRGAGMADVWTEALAAARGEAETGGARILAYGASGEAPLALDVSTLGSAEEPGSVVPATGESTYLAAFAALRGALADIPTAEVEAVLVTRPRWSAWDPQLASLRSVAWPAGLQVVAVGNDTASGRAETDAFKPERTVLPPIDRHLRAALTALGYRFATGEAESGANTPRVAAGLRFVESGASRGADLLAGASAGDTVIVYETEPGAPSSRARILRVGRHTLSTYRSPWTSAYALSADASVGLGGSDSEDHLLPIVLDDGTPVAAARSVGGGCVVRFGGDLTASANDPAFPWLVRALLDGCRPARDTRVVAGTGRAGSAPLDLAALEVLRGQGPEALALATSGLPTGRPLAAWVLALALGVALLEWLVVRRGASNGALGEGAVPELAGSDSAPASREAA